MTRFDELLRQNREAILRRWLEAALSSYPAEASAAFSRLTDPFANPVGHSLREGMRGVFQALLADAPRDELRRHLEAMIRIRSVQAFLASEAIGFIFELKAVVRAALGSEADQPRFAAELARLDAHIDRVALAAFDLFVEGRERICQLRASEVERRFSWISGKICGRGSRSDVGSGQSGPAAPRNPDARTELIR